jgi:transposase
LSRVEQFERIRRDHAEEGLSVRALARRHQVHRRTVHQALESAIPPPRAIAPPRLAPALGAHAETVRKWLTDDLTAPRKQRHTARRVWTRLIDEEGADVAESTVRAFVRATKAQLGAQLAPVFIPQVHDPGDEAECDFGEVHVFLAGALTRLFMFVLRLSHSGRACHVCFPTDTQEAFLEGHVIAFERFGGIPGRIRYDNLRDAVVKILKGRNRTESDRFIALRSHYLFDSFFCEPGENGAHEKGGVEGEVGRFRRNHMVPVPKVGTIAQLNAMLAAADRADDARHIAGRKVTVGQAAAAELPKLRPLPDEPFEVGLPRLAKVDRKARIRVGAASYSVPVRLADRVIEARLTGLSVRAFDGGRLVASHERSPHRGSETLVLDHYLEILAHKPGALPGSVPLAQARAAGAFTPAHERFWSMARRRHGDADGTRALIEVLLLHRTLPFPAVHAALDAVNKMGSVDPELVAIEARRLTDRRPPSVVPVRPETPGATRPKPTLLRYDALLQGTAR